MVILPKVIYYIKPLGLSMNYNSFKNNLNKNAFQEVNPLDQVYDPDKHFAIDNYEDKDKVNYYLKQSKNTEYELHNFCI